jgi:RNA polymerase sigma factor (sigma-70 family)
MTESGTVKTDNPSQEPSDEELVLKSQKGSLTAYDELVRRYYGRIYSLVYNMTSNREDAEDLVQEVFVKAHRSLPRFHGNSAFYTWIYRIAVNRTINYRKKRTRQQAMRLDDMTPDVREDAAFSKLVSNDTPVRRMRISELQKKLNEALQTLSEKHKQVVVMHDVQGMAHEEIAKVLRVSTGTVRSRLFYARKHLQSELAGLM